MLSYVSGVSKRKWVDARREDILDAPYFHVVFTVPEELNPIVYSNQKFLYCDCISNIYIICRWITVCFFIRKTMERAFWQEIDLGWYIIFSIPTVIIQKEYQYTDRDNFTIISWQDIIHITQQYYRNIMFFCNFLGDIISTTWQEQIFASIYFSSEPL